MLYGYAGKILRVNLTTSKISTQETEGMKDYLRKFMGGRGLGARILFDELNPGIDPLSPDNKLIFITGPVTGMSFPGNAKYGLMAKSPLTGVLGEAYAGGYFGPELKFAGFDAVIIEGKAEDPVYIWISDDEVEIRNAKHLWKKPPKYVQDQVQSEVKNKKARVACIGSAGENLVKYACVLSEITHLLGRCGLGAVAGSKNLKAVVVKGSKKPTAADEKSFIEYSKKAFKEIRDYHAKTGRGVPLKYGAVGSITPLNESGRLPTMNFRRGTFDGAEKIDGKRLAETILIGRESCYGCRYGCKLVVKADEPYIIDPAYGGPEYESMTALGSFCMNDDLYAVAKAVELCNKYGLDAISTGNTIAFAMECYEHGLITKKDVDGLDLAWGNADATLHLVEKIAKREGIGNVLAEGVRIAAERIGKGAKKYAMHVKGLELPMHEPRGKKGVGLSYATSNRGGSQTQEFHDDTYEIEANLAPEIGLTSDLIRDRLYTGPDKAKTVIIGQNWWSFYHSAVVCIWAIYPYTGFSLNTFVNTVSSITGWDTTAKELITLGERAWNLCRAFNVREGITRKDDNLPERFSTPLPDGPYKGESIPQETLEKLLDYYYEFRGWNRQGIPKRRKLEELNLTDVADQLEKLGKL